jgi:hypothetical protein
MTCKYNTSFGYFCTNNVILDVIHHKLLLGNKTSFNVDWGVCLQVKSMLGCSESPNSGSRLLFGRFSIESSSFSSNYTRWQLRMKYSFLLEFICSLRSKRTEMSYTCTTIANSVSPRLFLQ